MKIEDLTPPQMKELVDAFNDHQLFCRESLRLRDRAGSVTALEQWPSQAKLHKVIEKQKRAGKPIRIVVLKTRRSGFTVGGCSEAFHEVPHFPGRKGIIVADKYEPAGMEAFDYLIQFQKNYVPIARHGVKLKLPNLVKDTQQHMVWENDSGIEVLTAQGGREIRGGGRHFALGDELAFWDNPGKTLPGLLNMVPKLPGTMIILQSTANGIGGEFYDLCQRAMDPANEDGFEFVFFGWLEHPLYRMQVEDPAKFQASLDGEERTLHEMHGATLEQLRWRRSAIATECLGKVDVFHQEYPTSPEEAFLSSGRPALDHKALARMPAWKNPTVGELQELDEFPKPRRVFIPRDHGALVLGKLPDKTRSYVIGADPSKGVDVSESKRGDDPDYSVASVFDLHTGEQVAQFRERLRPVPFAEYLALLGRFFNWAFLVPEANDAGFIDALLRTKYPEERIYNRRRDPTDRRGAQPQEIGFETTTMTRPWLIAALDEAIRAGGQNLNDGILIRSPIALQECRTFVIKPNGKQEHQTGCHDDCVLAAALAVMGLRFAPRTMRMGVQAQQPANPRKVMQGYGERKGRDDDDD